MLSRCTKKHVDDVAVAHLHTPRPVSRTQRTDHRREIHGRDELVSVGSMDDIIAPSSQSLRGSGTSVRSVKTIPSAPVIAHDPQGFDEPSESQIAVTVPGQTMLFAESLRTDSGAGPSRLAIGEATEMSS